jgi:hypothetical protein
VNISNAFVGFGVVCVIAALVGGGVKALGSEIPVVNSLPRQLLLAAVGAALIVAPTFADREATFRVTAVRAQWNDATAMCGRKVGYTGFITVSGSGGTVEYRFRVDGSPKSKQILTAARPQTFAVSGAEYFAGWPLSPLGPAQLDLEILQPNTVVSQPSRLNFFCPRA